MSLPRASLVFLLLFTWASSNSVMICSDSFPAEVCEKYLPSERGALANFLKNLLSARSPPPGEFSGRGIVMTGGPQHVLKALANLHVLRDVLKNDLPVEFWHAFELSEAHCLALRELQAECRTLRYPGALGRYGAIIPTIMQSSFQHVIWIDCDVMFLADPSQILDTAEYRDAGAVVWPDHWGAGCTAFGNTAKPNHVLWDLLDIPYDRTDILHKHEHETGVFYVDKVRHWKPLLMADYLLNRDFFQRVMAGDKDTFRFAWLKLQASMHVVPIRPGLLGHRSGGMFFGPFLVQFWSRGGPLLAEGKSAGVPLFVHQKKKPSPHLGDLLTFDLELGECAPMRIVQGYFKIDATTMQAQSLLQEMPTLRARLLLADDVWQRGWAAGRERFTSEPSLNLDTVVKTLSSDVSNQMVRADLPKAVSEERAVRTDPGRNVEQLPEGWEGTWNLVYSHGAIAKYQIHRNGSVQALNEQGQLGSFDGAGHGQLFKKNDRNFTHVLYGVHSTGKFERLKLNRNPQFPSIELEHWVGQKQVCTATGTRTVLA